MLTKPGDGCIIKSGGGTLREYEYSHKGIDRATQIDRKLIESNEYRRKFDNATDNPTVNKALYDSAKEMLYDRSGTRYESMRWIDGDTGEVIVEFYSMGRVPGLTGEEHELKVEYGDSVLHKLKGHNNVVTIHNHPNSTAPSVGDLNSSFLHRYTTGFVAAHDGRVFSYVSNQEISIKLYELQVKDFALDGHDMVESQMLAFADMSRNFNINVVEVKK
jgi:hypothetical protein